MKDESPREVRVFVELPSGAREPDDPLDFVTPEEHPELMALLEQLRKDSAAAPRGAASAPKVEGPAKAEARRKRWGTKSWVVGLLVLAIVAPMVTLGFALLLQRGGRGVSAGAAGGVARADGTAVAVAATVAGTDTDTVAGTDTDTDTGADTGTGTDTGTATGADTAAATSVGAARRSRRPASARGKDLFPKEVPVAPSVLPSVTAEVTRPHSSPQEKGPSHSGGSEFF